MTVDELAARMYAERVQERGPAWADLGETTRNVWREFAMSELLGGLA